MRKLTLLILVVSIFTGFGFAQDSLYNRIEITPQSVNLNVGDTVEFQGVYYDTTGSQTDTSFQWSVAPDSIGEFAGNLFIARDPGSGIVTAQLDTLTATAVVVVEDDQEDDEPEVEASIEIFPEVDEIYVGDSLEYNVKYITSDGAEIDTTADFVFSPDTLAEFEGNILIAKSPGTGMIVASFGGLSDTLEVEIEPVEDDEDGNEGEDEGNKIVIHPRKDEIYVGDTLSYYVEYTDSSGVVNDTNAVFSFVPDSLAEFDGDILVAKAAGEGLVIATLDDLTDTLALEIEHKDDEDEEQEKDELPTIKISPRNEEIALGDTVQFNVFYIDTNETQKDTSATLSIVPDSLGLIIDNKWFVAENEGVGKIFATLDGLTDSIEVEIEKVEDDDEEDDEQEDENDEKWNLQHRLVLSPKDTIVNIGAVIDYEVRMDSEEGTTDTTVDEWILEGMEIGELSDGKLTTTAPGFALVKAKIGDKIGTAFVIVEDAENDSVTNTVQITRRHMSPRKEYKVIKEVQEGELWRIGGFPHPLNIYNGGFIYFPKGSLKEDIRIHVSVPRFAEVNNDSVRFGPRNVVNGISFEVFVDDTLSEPYYFNTPLIVGLVFKRGLLRNLNIAPRSLRLYYVNQKADSLEFDSTGIENSTLSYYRNMIFSHVEHFSTIAIRGEQHTTSLEQGQQEMALPKSIELHQNYPNPFNPVTNIQYNIPSGMNVKLDVYNILGQKVKILVNKNQKAGRYTIQWNAGDLSSGVYLIRLQAGHRVTVKRALLLK